VIDNEAAIVGDAMFGVFSGSVFPPFADDTRSMVKSWKKLLDTGCGIYLPAHGWERRRDVLERQYEKYRKVYDL
jgi:glyoxylase-like metal-dependent hydrolase (beta-lactamase superfamily II)